MYSGYITDVEGIKVGHNESETGMTGCTVVTCEEGATGGVNVRGSAFGLDASSGVMKYLEEKNIGLDVGVTKVPIVASAVIFDLNIGNHRIRPDLDMGYIAAKNANNNENRQGNIGAGMGATIGKILGPKNAMKAGLGSATVKVGDLVVSAMVVVNSFGDIYDFIHNKQIAGVYDYKNNKLLNTIDIMKNSNRKLGFNTTNTTIGIIATNAILTKAESNKVAEMAHNGFARSINPIHTMMDGDTIFTMATNRVNGDINLVGTIAAEAMSKSIINGVVFAEGSHGLISYKDI